MSYVTNLAAGIGHAANPGAGIGTTIGAYASKKRPAAKLGAGAGKYAANAATGAGIGATVGATATPTTPAAAPAVTLGGDPSLLAGEDAAQRARAIADANATFQSGQLQATYGLTPTGSADTANPFGLAALLQHSHDQEMAGNTNSLASRGQLYSGTLQNAQDAEARHYTQGQDQLLKSYQGAQGKIALDKASAYSSAAGTQNDALLTALLAALKGTS